MPRVLASPSLYSFLKQELNRGYVIENDEHRYSAREKVYSFMQIPREVEKFTAYGFFLCAYSYLYVYTFLPIRYLKTIWAIISRPVLRYLGYISNKLLLTNAEICDLYKGSMLLFCTYLMFYIDINMMYHLIKSQSVIKLYIFYNMLEVGDRLFSAFGQDIIDALLWTATAGSRKKQKGSHLGIIPHLIFALAYLFLHSMLVLFQATTLNVAINSSSKSLLTIMISNNFVELKGSVFKKFDKKSFFQVACTDVRERFNLFTLLFIVMLQTMKEYSWEEERFWVLLPDCLLVLAAEVVVDWIKHAFITRFNDLSVNVYSDYITSLAYDTVLMRKKSAFSDHTDLVARRMGFIPLPLVVVMVRVLAHAIFMEGWPSMILMFLVFVLLILFHTLISLVMLGKGCALMKHHKEVIDTISQNVSANAHETNTIKQEKAKGARKSLVFPIKLNGMGDLEKVRLSEEVLRISDILIDCKHLTSDNQKRPDIEHSKLDCDKEHVT